MGDPYLKIRVYTFNILRAIYAFMLLAVIYCMASSGEFLGIVMCSLMIIVSLCFLSVKILHPIK